MPIGVARAVMTSGAAAPSGTPGSSGFVLPSAGDNVNDGGNTAWATPGNITADDGARATCNRSSNGTSQLLRCTFGPSLSGLPAGAHSFTFIFRLQRGYSSTVPPQQIRDNTIRISLDGTAAGMVGDNKADTATNWPLNTDTNKDYGSSADSWNLSLTRAQVTASTFCVMVKCTHTVTGDGNARSDVAWLDVHYLA